MLSKHLFLHNGFFLLLNSQGTHNNQTKAKEQKGNRKTGRKLNYSASALFSKIHFNL